MKPPKGQRRIEIVNDSLNGHHLSNGEIDNLVYAVCKTAGWTMRSVDLAVVELMRDRKLSGIAEVRNVVRTAAEYVWDHVLGKPPRPSVSAIYHGAAPWVNNFLKLPVQTRSSTK